MPAPHSDRDRLFEETLATADPGDTFNPEKLTLSVAPPSDASDDVEATSQVNRGSETSQRYARDEKLTELFKVEGTPFELQRVVGKGGYGEVWEATQKSLGRRVAVKKIKGDKSGSSSLNGEGSINENLTKSFKSEALITAVLDHPNIVPVYDLTLDSDGEPMLAMKLVRGTSWDVMLKVDRELPFAQRLARHLPVLVDVCQAVAFAHSRGVLHRDLKPSQVMVGEFGEVLLMDWGLACLFVDPQQPTSDAYFADGHRPVPLARAGNPAGTPAYMAPEQTLQTSEKLGPWTDVFLLGGILYNILTDTPPYQGKTAAKVLKQAAEAAPQTPEARVEDGRRIPPELSRICMKALSRDSWKRHHSASEFLAELQAFMTGFGKSRESVELTDRARELLSGDPRTYALLSEIERLVERAGELSRENPAVPELRRWLVKSYFDVALSHNETILARQYADKFDDENTKAESHTRVERHIEWLAHRERQRQVSMLAAAILLVLLIVTALWGLDRSRAANLRTLSPAGRRDTTPVLFTGIPSVEELNRESHTPRGPSVRTAAIPMPSPATASLPSGG
ncbi:MAG: serine/threonine-protein kinase [Candidatus Sumerlaeia bacterium]|nr:serine/threonine-protein kinase [Candidatus Sumerlaeia bacterium]